MSCERHLLTQIGSKLDLCRCGIKHKVGVGIPGERIIQNCLKYRFIPQILLFGKINEITQKIINIFLFLFYERFWNKKREYIHLARERN